MSTPMTSINGMAEDGSRIVERAVSVLDRAERDASLSASEVDDLRRALAQARPASAAPAGFDPAKMDRFVAVLSGAAELAALGAVSGTVVGFATGSLVFPGLGTIAGAFIGAGIAAARERRTA